MVTTPASTHPIIVPVADLSVHWSNVQSSSVGNTIGAAYLISILRSDSLGRFAPYLNNPATQLATSRRCITSQQYAQPGNGYRAIGTISSLPSNSSHLVALSPQFPENEALTMDGFTIKNTYIVFAHTSLSENSAAPQHSSSLLVPASSAPLPAKRELPEEFTTSQPRRSSPVPAAQHLRAHTPPATLEPSPHTAASNGLDAAAQQEALYVRIRGLIHGHVDAPTATFAVRADDLATMGETLTQVMAVEQVLMRFQLPSLFARDWRQGTVTATDTTGSLAITSDAVFAALGWSPGTLQTLCRIVTKLQYYATLAWPSNLGESMTTFFCFQMLNVYLDFAALGLTQRQFDVARQIHSSMRLLWALYEAGSDVGSSRLSQRDLISAFRVNGLITTIMGDFLG